MDLLADASGLDHGGHGEHAENDAGACQPLLLETGRGSRSEFNEQTRQLTGPVWIAAPFRGRPFPANPRRLVTSGKSFDPI